jgi:crotonobetainyl-CoA:carnitine CoA-transferase CaiB-like acyl-CoA transferase
MLYEQPVRDLDRIKFQLLILARRRHRVSAKHWLFRIGQAVVPAGPINTVEEALADPQIVARGLQIAPEGMPGLRSPLRFTRSGLVLDRAAPQKH